MKNVSILDVKRERMSNNFHSAYLIDYLLMTFSPYCTKLFVRLGVRPNIITCLMILFGLIGGGLYFVQNIYVQVISIIFIYLWYYMDVVDGEVARVTKVFSTFGKELDYTAHVINHPLYTMAIVYNVYQFNTFFAAVVLSIGLIDSIYRALNSFSIIYTLKEPMEIIELPTNTNNRKVRKLPIYKYVILNLANFPTFIMFFPILFIVNHNVAFLYAILVLLTSFFITSLSVFRWLRKIV